MSGNKNGPSSAPVEEEDLGVAPLEGVEAPDSPEAVKVEAEEAADVAEVAAGDAEGVADEIDTLGGDSGEVREAAAELVEKLTVLKEAAANPSPVSVAALGAAIDDVPRAVALLEVTVTDEVIAHAAESQARFETQLNVAVKDGGLLLPEDPGQRHMYVREVQRTLGVEEDGVVGPETLTALLTREFAREVKYDGNLNDELRSGLQDERDIIVNSEPSYISSPEERHSLSVALEGATQTRSETLTNIESHNTQIQNLSEATGIVRAAGNELNTLDEVDELLRNDIEGVEDLIAFVNSQGVSSTEVDDRMSELADTLSEFEFQLQANSERRDELEANIAEVAAEYELTGLTSADEIVTDLSSRHNELLVTKGRLEGEVDDLTTRIDKIALSLAVELSDTAQARVDEIDALMASGLTSNIIVDLYIELQNDEATPLPGGLTSEQITEAYNSLTGASQERAAARVEEARTGLVPAPDDSGTESAEEESEAEPAPTPTPAPSQPRSAAQRAEEEPTPDAEPSQDPTAAPTAPVTARTDRRADMPSPTAPDADGDAAPDVAEIAVTEPVPLHEQVYAMSDKLNGDGLTYNDVVTMMIRANPETYNPDGAEMSQGDYIERIQDLDTVRSSQLNSLARIIANNLTTRNRIQARSSFATVVGGDNSMDAQMERYGLDVNEIASDDKELARFVTRVQLSRLFSGHRGQRVNGQMTRDML